MFCFEMECLNKMEKSFELIEQSDVEKLKEYLQEEVNECQNGGKMNFCILEP